MSLLRVEGLSKTYTTRFTKSTVTALKNVTFTVDEGEYVAIMGESGSGKTTLLNILAMLDKPTSGSILLNEHDISKQTEKQRTAYRRDNLGFVFQEFNLLDTFSVLDNILLPLVLKNESYEKMMNKAEPIINNLQIQHIINKFSYEISGGEKQRTAVARAMITSPKLLLADEPTGSLDSSSSQELLSLFSKINKEKQTIIMVTHSTLAASKAERILFIKDGIIFHQLKREQLDDQQFYQKINETLLGLVKGDKNV